MSGTWTAELYEDSKGSSPIQRWMDDLGELEFAALNAAITHVLEPRGLTLGGTEWLKPLRGGLWEFRIRHTEKEIVSMFAEEGVEVAEKAPGKILLRVFVTFFGDKIVLLLAGYDKGADPSEKRQQREIERARKLLTARRMEESKEKKAQKRR